MRRLLLLAFAAACTDAPAPEPAPAPAPLPAPASVAVTPVPSAPYFDPATVRAGDTVAAMHVLRVDLQRTPYNEFAGSVAFAGAVEIAGEYRPHFDYPEVDVPCFWADSASWHKLPRMRGDGRTQVWFCFRNRAEAIRRLGALERGRHVPMTIRIDSFTAHMSQSDAWDEAVLR